MRTMFVRIGYQDDLLVSDWVWWQREVERGIEPIQGFNVGLHSRLRVGLSLRVSRVQGLAS